ncbi:hypothetical protein VR7878_01223 [Vibrio ruber DSM 16370]|uniref:Uncharacterized protein n=1 Tax=Vibrio ruber (strain DSM 16370 / JCM 11486 / BCRC 17186 / CECT 7878 / LMG 23124 / VR1) TaxID=1123498 RepID=A0A1R4LFT0_VIBR1|nr:hypothetical protein [Vibrio ruber]SJN55390.1 hypothetical protein VR7878_01223 [Vibrio ruber DSM 16370]
MNGIYITYYKYKNDAETAFKNVLKYILKDKFEEKDFHLYKEDYFNDFKDFHSKKLAFIQFSNEKIQYQSFIYTNPDFFPDRKSFYGVSSGDFCFTNITPDADFEKMDHYVQEFKEKLSKINFNIDEPYHLLDLDLICFISSSIEEIEEIKDSLEVIEYEIDDIEEY